MKDILEEKYFKRSCHFQRDKIWCTTCHEDSKNNKFLYRQPSYGWRYFYIFLSEKYKNIIENWNKIDYSNFL